MGKRCEPYEHVAVICACLQLVAELWMSKIKIFAGGAAPGPPNSFKKKRALHPRRERPKAASGRYIVSAPVRVKK